MKRFFGELRRFILWDHPRGCWQYDVMVGLILAFIFLSPRAWFRDQPRIPSAQNIVMLPAEQGFSMFWIEPGLLQEASDGDRQSVAAEMVKQRTGRPHTVLRLEAIRDSEGETQGYLVVARQ